MTQPADGTPPRAAILTVQCVNSSTLFGLRMEEAGPGIWLATWAFAIPPDRAAREGYTETRLDGTFDLAEGYPGCPGCENQSYAQCGACKGLGCSTGRGYWTCPHCGIGDTLRGRIKSVSSREF